MNSSLPLVLFLLALALAQSPAELAALASVLEAMGCPAADCPPTNPCSSRHVTCAGGVVTRINIEAGTTLRGSLSDQVALLTSLTTLYFSGMEFTGSSIPLGIGRLTGLTRLGLHKSGMVGTLPAGLFGLTRLEYLRLSANPWTGSLSTAIGQLSKLTELYLGDGQLTGTIPTEISKLTALVTLYLSNQRFTSTIPAGLASLPLQTIYLTHNSLTGAVPNIMAGTCFLQDTGDTNCLSCAGVSGCMCATNACVPRTTPLATVPPTPTAARSTTPLRTTPAPLLQSSSTTATSVASTGLATSAGSSSELETSSNDIVEAPAVEDWALIGGVVGGVAALVVITIVVCLLVRRSRDPDDSVRGSQKTFRTPRQSTPRSSSAVSVASEYGDLALKTHYETGTMTQPQQDRQVYHYAVGGGQYQVGDIPAADNNAKVAAIRQL